GKPMSDIENRPKDSELQAASGPNDPELESLIAPQGYDPDMVDDIATMESPQKQRRQAIRFGIIMILLMGLGYWLCSPNSIPPENLEDPIPYEIDSRSPPPSDKFLEDSFPRSVGDFNLVDLKETQSFQDPYIGAFVLRGTYLDSAGNPVIVEMIEAESYINARRYLENYKNLLESEANATELNYLLYIETNYVQWNAPGYAERAYGLAWNNDRYFISVTSPISMAQQSLASQFPY
ncbi:MAG: hypothetical protein AAF485_33235, partial [Chloroflexota bacterium]